MSLRPRCDCGNLITAAEFIEGGQCPHCSAHATLILVLLLGSVGAILVTCAALWI